MDSNSIATVQLIILFAPFLYGVDNIVACSRTPWLMGGSYKIF